MRPWGIHYVTRSSIIAIIFSFLLSLWKFLEDHKKQNNRFSDLSSRVYKHFQEFVCATCGGKKIQN
jgi:hypothetical protein